VSYFNCTVCGAPAGKPCTTSCDDDSVPVEQVKLWAASCECGAAKLGALPESPAHSRWCPVSPP
jgi:formylmethanofuran dehydrogenase subunit B